MAEVVRVRADEDGRPVMVWRGQVTAHQVAAVLRAYTLPARRHLRAGELVAHVEERRCWQVRLRSDVAGRYFPDLVGTLVYDGVQWTLTRVHEAP